MNRLRGLYVITPEWETGALINATRKALEGGARLVQYRNKAGSAGLRLEQARMLHRLCLDYTVPLIINDDVALCREVGAEGVHLGREDAGLPWARQVLGSQAIVGVSCYNDLDRAREAQALGADYVAFGRFFPSRTKPDAVPASLSLLQTAREVLQIPIVAIGGITPENGRALLQAGANMLAVIGSIYQAADIRATAAGFTRWFNQEYK